jgi:hypothetical protein
MYDDRPAVRANGTVKPSAKPIMMSRMTSPCSECCSAWNRRRLALDRMIVGRRSKVGSTAVEDIVPKDFSYFMGSENFKRDRWIPRWMVAIEEFVIAERTNFQRYM